MLAFVIFTAVEMHPTFSLASVLQMCHSCVKLGRVSATISQTVQSMAGGLGRGGTRVAFPAPGVTE